MRICVTAETEELNGPVDPRFGRCRYFIIYDTEKESYETVPNTNKDGVGGVGVQSGQLMSEKTVQVVLTGNVGPNAYKTLEAGNIKVVTGAEGTVEEALNRYREGNLNPAQGPTVEKDTGKKRQ